MIQIPKNTAELDDETLEKLWKKIDWRECEESLARIQSEIAILTYKGNTDKIYATQKRLVRSLEARVLAVKHVCESALQPGVDNVKWTSGTDKMRAALSLTSRGYIASPMRFVVIHPKGATKDRHVQIPTFFDRAMQTLYAYALDPVSESSAEKKSFAFRKGRSMLDVHKYILNFLSEKEPPRYFVKADVKACYGSISHDWLLANIPVDKAVLRQFLKAGYIFGGELFPSDDFGISLGSSISPILGNMTLDGIQNAIYSVLHGRVYDIDYTDGNLLRFADDMLIAARTKESAEKILQVLQSFLAVRGLSLSIEKTHIIDISEGFDFLSRHYEIKNGTPFSCPSRAAVQKMEQSLKELIEPWRGGQKMLIEKINRKLAGWASYHKITEAKADFRHIDGVVKALLLELCEKLNPKMSRKKIIDKYFYKEPDGGHVYALLNKPDVKIIRIGGAILVSHIPISVKMNPYLDTDYFEERTGKREIFTVTGKYKPLWERQKGRCFYCGKTILSDCKKCIVPIDPTAKETLKNSGYIHDFCSGGQAEFYKTETEILSNFDLWELLERLNGGKLYKKSKFTPLEEYFSQKTERVFTLTFKKIEEIIGYPLCENAKKSRPYWFMRSEKNNGKISRCWLTHGYEIRSLNFEKKHVVFERNIKMGEILDIPPVFFTRIPTDAKAEIENFLEYVRKKYGL